MAMGLGFGCVGGGKSGRFNQKNQPIDVRVDESCAFKYKHIPFGIGQKVFNGLLHFYTYLD